MFSKFKTEFHSFDETLKHIDRFSSNDVMKLTSSFSKAMKMRAMINETSHVLHVVERET